MSENHVVLTPVPDRLGTWRGATAIDRRRLARLAVPRAGDRRDPATQYTVGHLVALCAARGISVTFWASSPAPAAEASHRRNGRDHR